MSHHARSWAFLCSFICSMQCLYTVAQYKPIWSVWVSLCLRGISHPSCCAGIAAAVSTESRYRGNWLSLQQAFRACECFGLAQATEIWCCTLRSMHRWHFSANSQHSTPGFKRMLASLQSSKPACNCLMPLSIQGGEPALVIIILYQSFQWIEIIKHIQTLFFVLWAVVCQQLNHLNTIQLWKKKKRDHCKSK